MGHRVKIYKWSFGRVDIVTAQQKVMGGSHHNTFEYYVLLCNGGGGSDYLDSFESSSSDSESNPLLEPLTGCQKYSFANS